MATLLNQKLLKSCVEKFHFPENEQRQKIEKIISAWQKSFKDHDLSKAKETALQGRFFAKFFCEILGYTTQDDGNDVWTLKQEAKTEVDGKEADGALGFYSKTSEKTRCVIELKDAQQSLDKKQLTRENKQTPVEQAFQYLYKFADCDWVIVSNFRYTRLYHKSKGQTAYEEFDILTLHEEKEFKKFYYCLCQKNLIDEHAHSPMDELVKQSGEACIDITKEFYLEFKNVRRKLFDHIVENNPHFDKKLLLEKTQKILDRFVFIFFCEDTAGLLPHNTVEKTYELGRSSYLPSECKIWDQFRGLFRAIDRGRSDVNPPINAYNGGLFADDEILNKQLIIRDEIFEDIKNLARYDFESDLNVNILGHIFEQSLSDLEQIKNDLDGIQQEKKNAKRKKDGIFYTPEYITQYIVKETIGKYLEDNPEKLEEIKILDPACGSGAFLNQAHSFLVQQRKIQRDEKIAKAEENQLDLYKHVNTAEMDRSILLNNLYGVDLNKESVEITKLALWLKTANAQCKLNNLDENIKCGNSLIDDETIAGDKAFKWEAEFQEVIADGGFDCIIGNPPYVYAREKVSDDDKNYYYKNYVSSEYQVNTFVLFIEKSIQLLVNGGYFGLIIPNTLLQLSSMSKLRKYIFDTCSIKKIINLVGYSFDGVGVETVILICQKSGKTDNVKSLNVHSEEDLIKKEYKNINACDWSDNRNYEFNVFLSEQEKLLLEKIWNNSETLETNYIVKAGLVAYEKGKGKPKQTAEDVKNRIYDFDYKFDDTTYPYFEGKNITRYHDDPTKSWLKYGDNLAAPRTFDLFSNPRVLVREITSNYPKSFSATYVEKIVLNNLSIVNVLANDNSKENLLFLLSLLNSYLISFYYKKTNPKANRTMFPKVILQDLRLFPVCITSSENKKHLSELAEKMIELNKRLHEETQKALELIKLEYQPKKISQKLEVFYTLGVNPFIEELDKLGVMTPSAEPAGEISASKPAEKSSSRHARASKLTLSQKEELISWYKQKADALNKLKSEIDTLDREIDQEVYKLYNLTPEEISMIEGVSSNKML